MGKIDISPIGKLETRESKAETVNTEHVWSCFFHPLKLIGTLHISGFTQNQLMVSPGVKNDHLLNSNLSLKYRYSFFVGDGGRYLTVKMHMELNC